MVSTLGHFLVLGVNPFARVRSTGFTDGDYLWDPSLRQYTGDGKFDRETFRVGCGRIVFFWGGVGGREEELQVTCCWDVFTGWHEFQIVLLMLFGHVLFRRFHRMTRVPNCPFDVVYYILSSGGFVMVWTITNVVLVPRWPGQTCVLFKFRQLDDLLYTLKTVKGLVHLVPPWTPRNSVYGVLCTYGLCYMLFLLYV